MQMRLKNITDGLLKAIQAEHEGHFFYKMAAQTTIDAKGKEVFEQMALEELNHLQFLQTQYASFLTTGKAAPQLELGSRMKFAEDHPIFSPELRARVHEAHFEMTALSIAIQLELNAMHFYGSQAEQAASWPDKVMAAFFQELVAWETGHYQALLAQQEILKEGYWQAAGFAPF